MSDAEVVRQAAEYLSLVSDLTPPSDLYFRSFVTEGVDGLAELCEAARRVAGGGGDGALASLVVAPGTESCFVIDGTHARATLKVCPTPHTRLVVLLILLALAVVAVMVFAKRR